MTYPKLIVDEDICRSNIRRMKSKAEAHNLQFRPHFKTHQSLKIGDWFREEGVDKITVSSMKMAKYFASGICAVNDIAIVVRAIVASVYPDTDRMLLYCGAVHLSKEKLNSPESLSGYGLITKLDNNKRGDIIKGLKIDSLSQEHGIVSGDRDLIAKFKPGDSVGIIPVHSCLTADILKRYITTKGEEISMMPCGE